MSNKTKPWYHRGNHQQTSLHLRNAWTQDPTTRCAHCGLTLEQGHAKWGNNARWEADHREPGNPTAGYQPAHAHCNRSHGATHGNKQRQHRNSKQSKW